MKQTYVYNSGAIQLRAEAGSERRSFPHEAFPREDAQGYVYAPAIRARKRTLVRLRAETLRAEKIGALSARAAPRF